MQAIILAAGMGKRLKELTKNNTKCMVKVGGITLIERLLKQLEPYKLSRIVIVFGYKGKTLVDYVQSLNIQTPVEFVENPIYEKTNNIYSLYLAKEYLAAEDTLLFESDLIFEDSVIQTVINDSRPTLALVDKYQSWMDGTCVRLTAGDEISEFIPGNKLCASDAAHYYKTVNVYKFSKHFSKDYYIPSLEEYCTAYGLNEYYEQVLKVIVMLKSCELRALRLSGQKWYEIDDAHDLAMAESIFRG
ncbi:MAG: phosphocholine cytidylyltransferase family protein [Clostridiales bacterium]|nr:phosphocholine cytidylyltransferase family protein [Clostridiales bacterium]